MKSVVILIDYFGEWPDWFPVFLESCRANPTIDWCIHTDCPIPSDKPDNVRLISMTFPAYCEMASERLNVQFSPKSTYNICNLKPTFGYLHLDIIQGYDYFGFGDLDVIYGDIRAVYDDAVLSHNVIATHDYMCTGHLTLIRNEGWLREAFREIGLWREILENDSDVAWDLALDEVGLTALFSPVEAVRRSFGKKILTIAPSPQYYSNNHFVEQWTTPFVPYTWRNIYLEHPETWYWRQGKLTNTVDGVLNTLYLHLMNFKSKHWIDEKRYGDRLTWDRLDTCLRFDARLLQTGSQAPPAFRIDRSGISLIS